MTVRVQRRAALLVLASCSWCGCAGEGSGETNGSGSGELPLGVVLNNTFSGAGDAAGQCGDYASAEPLSMGDRAMVCLGFESENAQYAAGYGTKVIFYPKVDEYAQINVATRVLLPPLPPLLPLPPLPPLLPLPQLLPLLPLPQLLPLPPLSPASAASPFARPSLPALRPHVSSCPLGM